MFRFLQDGYGDSVDATFTAGTDMVVGMGVVKDFTTGNVKFPTTATSKDVFFVNKEAVPTGTDTIRGVLHDYDSIFMNIKEGEFVNLPKPVIGKRYWTDQFTTGVAVGDYVVVGTDGKFKTAATDDETNLKVYSTTIKDCGKYDGIAIEVVDWTTV